MGKYSVPEHIRKMKPKGTLVKVIKNHYYVYEYGYIKDDTTGKWKVKMGSVIGSIDERRGFVGNQRYLERLSAEEVESPVCVGMM